ncbi:putative Ig domain-containing protein [Cellulosimicrobium cellulans]|uniref:putative Ig domain-containing protein n=1 Tax=Cellulosimicrobium cellulans TaxID=1710 RepID=UPI0036E96506
MTMKSRLAALGAVLAVAIPGILAPASTAAAETGDPASIHTYDPTPGDPASNHFAVTANGVDVFAANYARPGQHWADFARFASDEQTPTITVTYSEPITSWRIHPERYYDEDAVTVQGNTITFKMSPELPYALVSLNAGRPVLGIARDPLEDPATVPDRDGANVVDLSDYMDDKSGLPVAPEHDQTVQFNAAIDELYSNPEKDTLYIPGGTYQYAGFQVWDQDKPVTVYTEEDALMVNRIQDGQHAMEPTIGLWNVKNMTFYGRGMFDGNTIQAYGGFSGNAWESHHQGGVMITHSENIEFNDTYARHAKQWNWESHTSKNVRLNNIKGWTPHKGAWKDGLNIASGQDVIIDGAFTAGNDDTFASGHYNPDDGFLKENGNDFRLGPLEWDIEDTFNIQVRNTLGWTVGVGNGIRIGHAAYGHQLRDYTFENFNSVNFTGYGITVQNPDRSYKSTYPGYESITVRNSSFDTSRTTEGRAININGKASGSDHDLIQDVVVDDVRFSTLRDYSAVNNVKNLTLTNLTVGGERLTRLTQGNIELSNVASESSGGRLSTDLALDTKPVIEPIPATTVLDGQDVTFTVAAHDDDGDSITLAADLASLPAGARFAPDTGRFTWTPTFEQAGRSYDVRFTATDATGASTSTTTSVAVRPHLVLADLSDVEAVFGEPIRFQLEAADAHGHAVTYASASELPAGAALDPATGTFVWEPILDQVGEHELVLSAADEAGSVVTATVRIEVYDPLVTKISLAPVADTTVQAWNAEANQNYGDSEHLRVLNPKATWAGLLGEGYAGGSSNRDAKLSLLKFDLSDYTDLKNVELEKATLSLTYFGPTKTALNGQNSLLVAPSAPDWVEGNGKYTPPARANTVAGAVMWTTKPSIDASKAVASSPFSVTAPGRVGNDSTYNASQTPVGATASTDVTSLVHDLDPGRTELSLAVNTAEPQDLIFVSREGAERNPNAAGMGPTLTLTVREKPVQVEVAPRCLAGKAYLAVRAQNAASRPVDISVQTPFGARDFGEVHGDRSAYQSFATRSTQMPAGSVTVTVDGSASSHEFAAANCS